MTLNSVFDLICSLGEANLALILIYYFSFMLTRVRLDWWCLLSRTNIMEAHIQLQSLVKSEYSSEEIESLINMVSIQDLQAQLDSLLWSALEIHMHLLVSSSQSVQSLILGFYFSFSLFLNVFCLFICTYRIIHIIELLFVY